MVHEVAAAGFSDAGIEAGGSGCGRASDALTEGAGCMESAAALLERGPFCPTT